MDRKEKKRRKELDSFVIKKNIYIFIGILSLTRANFLFLCLFSFFSLIVPPFSRCSRVLKPPGGGSSDIFGAAPEETSPRRIKAHNQSQLGSALFGDTNGTDNANAAVSPRSNKPGNDSYNRLFGPPAAPPTTPNARNHMRSNIPLSGGSSISSLSSGTATSPAKSTASSNSSSGIANGYARNGSNSFNDMPGKGPWRTCGSKVCPGVDHSAPSIFPC